MRTLVYKRTHTSDPCERGVFGCRGCMGSVRQWPFEAVIGVGGLGAEPEQVGIAYKITWIGVGAHTWAVDWCPDPVVAFDHFRLFDQAGEDFREVAPVLADRIYSKHVRTTMTFNDAEEKEVKRLIARAKRWPPSPELVAQRVKARPVRSCFMSESKSRTERDCVPNVSCGAD